MMVEYRDLADQGIVPQIALKVAGIRRERVKIWLRAALPVRIDEAHLVLSPNRSSTDRGFLP
jgi:hypothetical protein